ncbi:MAG: TetR family transcriptional regulator [Pseudobdellovibrio sp.]
MSEPMDSKKCILGVAAKLFAKLGLDKTSTREIAKESKANISLISYYFGGKEGLYKEVMREFAIELKEHVNTNVFKVDDITLTKENFSNEILLIIKTIIFFRLKYPEISKIFSREKLTGLEHSKEIHEEIFYPMTLEFIKLIKKAQIEKIVNPNINPALFFTLMTESIWGFFAMAECPTPLAKDCVAITKDTTELAKQISEIYIQGVLL